MRPKKREKIQLEECKPASEQIQSDHELFLQAFEKPTQIYRYLRTRHFISPLYLTRTLNYIRPKSSRKKNTRENFKVDSLLKQVEEKQKKDLQTESYKSEYMNLTFSGYYDKDHEHMKTIEVELILLKVCHKKRKDVTAPVMQAILGKAAVPCNPDTVTSPSKTESISVSSTNFSQSNGHAVKSYTLLIKVNCKRKGSTVNGMCNGDVSEPEELPPKRRRTSRASAGSELDIVTEKVENATYRAELVIYDKFKRCLLTDGDYEVSLNHSGNNKSTKNATWEAVADGKASAPLESINNCPSLKFKLCWNKVPLKGSPENSTTKPAADEYISNNRFESHINKRLATRLENGTIKQTATEKPKKRRIFYQFLYNNNTRQQTEAREDLHCPWCSLNCLDLYGLLKHLRTSHSRFHFCYSEHPKGARIDVSINECYDGSYVGNPQDLRSHIGYAFSRSGPVRRTPVTQVLVYRPKKPGFDLSEFLEIEGEGPPTRQLVQGHNRLYYHTVTYQPIKPQEINDDSEDENFPQWLKDKTVMLIDEFSDVNEGEKEVMKMWNLHMMKHNFIGDCQLPMAARTFVDEHGQRIVEMNLVQNFLLHLTNLYDFGLIRPEVVSRTVLQLYQLRDKLETDGTLALRQEEEPIVKTEKETKS